MISKVSDRKHPREATSSRAILQIALFIGLFQFITVARGQTPTAAVSTPGAVFLGETGTVTLSLDNTSATLIGYDPLVELILPMLPDDGAEGTFPDTATPSVSVLSASYLGSAIRMDTVGNLSSDTGELVNPITGQTITGPPGAAVLLFHIPLSSIAPDQPPPEIVLSTRLHALSPLTPQALRVRGVFNYGNDPTGQSPAISGIEAQATITPSVLKLSQSLTWSEAETATGPSFPGKWKWIGNVAEEAEVTQVSFSETLPDNFFVTAVDVIRPAGSTVQLTGANPGQALTVTWPTASGSMSNSSSEILVEITGYVPEVDADTDPVLSPTTGEGQVINQFDAEYTFEREGIEPEGGVQVSLSSSALTLQALSLATQKGASLQNDTLPNGISPGDSLDFQINLQVSDYHAVYDVSVGNGVTTAAGLQAEADLLGDGLSFDSGTAPTYEVRMGGVTVSGTFDGGNYTVDTSPAGQDAGVSRLTFDLSQQLVDDGAYDEDGILTGALELDPTAASGTIGWIRYRTTIDEAFDTPASGDASVDALDRLRNDVDLIGTRIEGDFLVGDASAASVSLPGIGMTHTISRIRSVEGVVTENPPGTPAISPGDEVTFSLKVAVPSGDIEDLILNDFLPYSMFSVVDVNGDGTSGDALGFVDQVAAFPAVGEVSFGPDDEYRANYPSEGLPAFSVSGTNNSLSLDFGDLDSPVLADGDGDKVYVFEIRFTLLAGIDELPDGFEMTSLAQATHGSTNGGNGDKRAYRGILYSKADPTVVMGAIWSSNPNGVITPGPTGNFKDAGSVGVYTEGQAGDTVRFAVTVQNHGSDPISVMSFGQTLPDAFDPDSLKILSVHRADGPALVMTPAVDGIADTADEVALLAGTLALDSSVSGNYLTGAVSSPGSYGSDALILQLEATLASTVAPSQATSTGTSIEVKFSETLPTDGGYTSDTGSTTLEIAPISMDKTLVTGGFGDEPLTGVVDFSGTSKLTATIGEIVTYELDLQLPQGMATNVMLTDTLPAGLQPIAVGGVKAVLHGMDASILSSRLAEGDTDVSSEHISITGQSVTFDFGTLTHGVAADKSLSGAQVRIYAVVTDDVINTAGHEITNTAQLSWAGDSTTAEVSLVVVRPNLTVDTVITELSAGDLEAGSLIQVQHTVRNVGDATTTSVAHDFALTSLIPTALYDPDTLAYTSTPTGFTPSTQDVTDGRLITYAGVDPIPGDEFVFRYTVNIKADISLPSTLLQEALGSGTSLPGTPGSGIESTETDDGSDSLNTVKPSSSLSLVSTSHDGTADSPLTVTIGERVVYRIRVNVPNGSFPGMTVKDLVPGGLDFVGAATDAGLTFPGKGYAFSGPMGAEMEARLVSVSDPDPTPLTFDTTDGSGDDPTFSFSTFTHLDDSDDSNDYFFLDVELVVLDRSSTVGYGSNPTRLRNRAQVQTSLSGGSDGRSNSVTATVAEPKLVITKSYVEASGDAGDELEGIITVENTGDANAYLVVVEELLEGIRFKTDTVVLSQIPTGWTAVVDPDTGTGDGSLDRTVRVTSNADTLLAPNASVEFRWKVQINDDIQTNSSFITTASTPSYKTLPGGQPPGSPVRMSGGEQDTATVTLEPAQISLSLVSTSDPSTPDDLGGFTRLTIGERVVLRVTVRLPEGTNVTPTFVIHPEDGLDFVGANPDVSLAFPEDGFGNFADAFGPTVEAAFQEVQDNDPTSADSATLDGNGQTASLVFADVLNIPDRIFENNSFSFDLELVATDEPTLNTPDSFSVTISGIGGSATRTFRMAEPVLALSKTLSPLESSSPDLTTVTLALENTGDAHAWEIEVEDVLDASLFDPASVTNVSATGGFSHAVTNGTVRFTSTPGLAAGESATLQFDVEVLPDPVTITNRASVVQASTLEDATKPSGMPERVTSGVHADAELDLPLMVLLKKGLQTGFDGAPAGEGDVIEYTLTIRNDGAATATGVTLVDAIPTYTTYVADSLEVDSVPVVGVPPTLSVDLGSLAAGASKQVTFDVMVDASLPPVARSITNTASLTIAERSGVTVSDNDPLGHDPRGDDGVEDGGDTGSETGDDDPTVIPLAQAAETHRSSLAFEDLKNRGWNDWDYNDLVLDVQTYYFLNDQDQVERLRVVYQVIARGAQDDGTVKLTLPFSGTADATVRYLDTDGSTLDLATSTATDTMTVEVFDSTQDALPAWSGGVFLFATRTERLDPSAAGKTAVVDLVLHSPADNPRASFSDSPHDTWLLVDSGEAIHRVQYFAGNTQFILEGPLAWRSLPYVLEFDEDFNWSAEMNAVWTSHPQFVSYIQSGGFAFTDWWQSWDDDLIWVDDSGTPPHPATPTEEALAEALAEMAADPVSLPSSTVTVGTGAPILASPVLRDLQGNGKRDILVSSMDGKVHRLDHTGAPITGWPKDVAPGVMTSPGVGDVDGDGDMEIVIGDWDGKVYVWELDGTPTTNFPVDLDGFIKSVCRVVDLNDDGKAEIVVHTADSKLHVLNYLGQELPGWPVDLQGVADNFGNGLLASSPVVLDLGLDGSLEIAVGSTASKVHVFHLDGTAVSGWPKDTGHAVYASVIPADMNGDLEPELVAASEDGKIWAWDANGNAVPGFPVNVQGGVVATVAAADLDGDGFSDLAVGTTSGRVTVLSHTGAERSGWPKTGIGGIYSSPLIVDIDGDSEYELVTASQDTWLRTWTRGGSDVAELTVQAGNTIQSTPAASDVDGDGKLELVFAAFDGNITLVELQGDATDQAVPWPGFRGDRNVVADTSVTDTDDDALPDALELQVFGNLGQNGSGNSDGDSLTNYQEWIAGTSLTDGSDVFVLQTETVDTIGKLCWNAVPGRTYRIYGCEQLGDDWVLLGTVAISSSASGGEQVWDEQAERGSVPAVRFYRVEVSR